ncbi:LacI family transcriptional regulator [Paenibacillus sambharensis]|uniref:LacI family transcriptional regulator n=1 Tax=Paenibacillus sambharensis TaxID=1803190 RepID=A0A2W1LBU6_9BACL|nr:LacI family DNA-binding transcriptional regulator [Paenibacillus sambharensis]PZD96373.1 LacI family transcriptional regulator [Paenibacillus sambharensis]
MKKTEINSIEIARLAGVSRSTVSRVINNYTNVPPATREKVMRVIEAYNYYPNLSAQVLAGKKTRTIGLFLIDAGHVSSDMLTNMLIVNVIEHASALGYYVLTNIIRNPSDSDTCRSVKEIFYQRRIDGGVFIGAANHEPLIEDLIAEGFVAAVVDQELPGHDEPNRITANYDNQTGMELAVNYLADLHHTSIGILNGDMKRLSGRTKYEGFQHAMKQRGLAVREQWAIPGDFHKESGYQAMTRLLEQSELPTAIVAANDSIAFGAIRAMKERGLQVPGDLSIIGFDDHALSSMHQPALTTIKVDFPAMLQQLTTTLIQTIENGTITREPIVAGSTLIIRQSCSPITPK